MTIMRIEGLTYGVEDLDECIRFLNDAGLARDENDEGEGALFRTPVNQFIRVVPGDTKSYPPAIEEGSTLRQVSWGVDNDAGLDEVAKDLGVARAADGMVRTVDPMGIPLEFRISEEKKIELVQRQYNLNTSDTAIHRRNEDVELNYESQPLRVCHGGVDVPKAKYQETIDFYMTKLRFKPIDDLRDVGVFMQCEGDTEHHQWFIFHRADKLGYNHIAIEVPDFDGVVLSAEHMLKKGWRESRRLGRHMFGSNVYRFIHAPMGGRIEYASDMDRMEKDFETRVYEKRPGHHFWMVRESTPGSGDH